MVDVLYIKDWLKLKEKSITRSDGMVYYLNQNVCINGLDGGGYRIIDFHELDRELVLVTNKSSEKKLYFAAFVHVNYLK